MYDRKRKIWSPSERKPCVVCRRDGANFTAQCSHSFHMSCINRGIAQANNYLCPLCRVTPKVNNANLSLQQHLQHLQQLLLAKTPAEPARLMTPPAEPARFSDDEPLLAVTATAGQTSNAGLQNVFMRAVPERDAVAASESVASFAVLVGLRAPPLSDGARRAPIDLVTVLDISSSMHGPKLDLVKHAVGFVIDNLGPQDRLSIVSFESRAQRVLPLRNMTDQGRVDAKHAVNSLCARGGTLIASGLTKGIRILEERLHRNPVASIMLLSDGKDSYRGITTATIKPTIPVHTFGFGADHSPVVMHAIADSSGGTFSFIESYETVQDAFARCVGGLLSVVVRELRLTLRSATDGVVINSIPSGRHASEIGEQGSRGRVTVGDMYADEEKEFLINVNVPVYANDGTGATPLLDVTCSYRDVISNQRVQMESAEIRRPRFPSLPDVKVKLEVDRQRNRLNAAEGFAEAQKVAETGDLKGARAILSSKRSSIMASASGQAGDGLMVKLEADMKETEARMGSHKKYEEAGRAFALSNMNEHAYQRATTRRRVDPSNNGAAGNSSVDTYVTPNMASMVSKSQQLMKIEGGGVKKEKY